MATVVPAEGATLQRVVATTPLVACRGLSREAFVKYDAAQARTAWAVRRRRRFALVESGDVLASAERYDLTGSVDGQPVNICGIAAVPHHDEDDGGSPSLVALVEQLLEEATRHGADLALLFRTTNSPRLVASGFDVMPTTEVELTMTESA